MNKAELITKLDAECDKSPKDKMLRIICEHMIELLHQYPEAAEHIDDKKTLSGAVNKMKEAARKRAVNGCGVLTDTEGFEIVHEYFGIKDIAGQAAGNPELSAAPTERKSKRRVVSLFGM